MQTPDYQITKELSSRSWVKADLSLTESAIIELILGSSDSLLFIPPRYAGSDLYIPSIPYDGIHIGLFSSGTTGTPKCMWVSREKLILNARMSFKQFRMSPEHKMLILASPWHIAGISWSIMALLAGIEYEIRTPYQADVPEFVSKLSLDKYSHLFTTPYMFRHLAKHGVWNVDELICGGSALTTDDILHMPNHAHFVTSGYGQTEAGGIISSYRSEASLWQKEGCVGSPAEQIRIRCNGTKVEPGPIYIHSPSAVCEGWLDTEDLGYKDENDLLFITHRKKDRVAGVIEK